MVKMRELVAQADATLGNEGRQGKEQRPATTLKSSKRWCCEIIRRLDKWLGFVRNSRVMRLKDRIIW